MTWLPIKALHRMTMPSEIRRRGGRGERRRVYRGRPVRPAWPQRGTRREVEGRRALQEGLHALPPARWRIGTLRKLGLVERIEAAGGRRNDLEAWTEWGWIRGGDPARVGHGYNIRRQTLDPILRNLALGTPGVSFHEGASVCDLTRDARGRIDGVVAEGAAGAWSSAPSWWSPPTGATSRVAKLAGVEAHVDDNGRFTYLHLLSRRRRSARAAMPSTGTSTPTSPYAFRNDDDTTLLGIFLPKGELRAFKADPMGNFRRFWDGVPDPPLIGDAAPICELRGATEIAEPLASRVGPRHRLRRRRGDGPRPDLGDRLQLRLRVGGLAGGAHRAGLRRRQGPPGSLDRGLARYRKVHRSRTRWHYAHIASLSTVRDLNWAERLVFSAATRDPELATRVLTYLGRTVGPLHLATPPALCRTALVNLGGLFSGRTNREARSLSPEAGVVARQAGALSCRHGPRPARASMRFPFGEIRRRGSC